MRRYFNKSKDGAPAASAEALKLWKTDSGRGWDLDTEHMASKGLL